MLSQALMDRLGWGARRMQGTRIERVTYHARVSAIATPLDIPDLVVRFRNYQLGALSTGLIEPTDQECVLQTVLATWGEPGIYDTLTRAAGTLWKVIGPVRGGRGRPHFLLQTRQVG
jgi:hypothetical protein